MSNKTAPKPAEKPALKNPIRQVTAHSRVTKLRVGTCRFTDGLFVTTKESEIAQLEAALANRNVPNNFQIVADKMVEAAVEVVPDPEADEKAPKATE